MIVVIDWRIVSSPQNVDTLYSLTRIDGEGQSTFFNSLPSKRFESRFKDRRATFAKLRNNLGIEIKANNSMPHRSQTSRSNGSEMPQSQNADL